MQADSTAVAFVLTSGALIVSAAVGASVLDARRCVLAQQLHSMVLVLLEFQSLKMYPNLSYSILTYQYAPQKPTEMYKT